MCEFQPILSKHAVEGVLMSIKTEINSVLKYGKLFGLDKWFKDFYKNMKTLEDQLKAIEIKVNEELENDSFLKFKELIKEINEFKSKIKKEQFYLEYTHEIFQNLLANGKINQNFEDSEREHKEINDASKKKEEKITKGDPTKTFKEIWKKWNNSEINLDKNPKLSFDIGSKESLGLMKEI